MRFNDKLTFARHESGAENFRRFLIPKRIVRMAQGRAFGGGCIGRVTTEGERQGQGEKAARSRPRKKSRELYRAIPVVPNETEIHKV